MSPSVGEPYTREVFAGAPKLKMVIRYGVGVDTIDLDAATEFGVVVGYLPDFAFPRWPTTRWRSCSTLPKGPLAGCRHAQRRLDGSAQPADADGCDP